MSAEIQLRLPDGSTRQVAAGTTVLEVAEGIGSRLAKAAVAGVVDGDVVEVSRPIRASAGFRILTARDPEALAVLRHSAAHLLAMAVLDLFPGTDLGFGPATDDGFYYDFRTAEPLTEEELPKIEKRMRTIAAEKRPYARAGMTRAEAKERLSGVGYALKIDHVDEIPEDEITFYDSGAFTDMCEGPHLPDTGWLQHFKLLSVSGAHWRGDADGVPMQRVRGTAFFTQDELDAYLRRLEEAKKRDHRKIGPELDLFSFHEEAPGFPFWHRKGLILWNEVEGLVRGELVRRGYQEIKTPQILTSELWHRSGHYDHYRDNMYFVEKEDRTFAVKPMNCPGACLVYGTAMRSYRELPLRVAEFGMVHRYELSGVLHGLFRVRGFVQDDAHVYCTPDQIEDEVIDCVDMLEVVYRALGFEQFDVKLSTRPEDRMGDDSIWDKAEAALEHALAKHGLTYVVAHGDGAFYGPKIDFDLTDALGRKWQCGTIQLDFQMPERFDLEYVGPDGERHRPVMIHRAIVGAMERMIGVLIEQYAGKLPVWLSPVQAAVLPITDETLPFAESVRERLAAAGIRVEVDGRNEKIGAKIRDATLQRVPYMLVVGKREAESGKVAVRARSGEDLGPMDLDAFLEMATGMIRERS